MTVSGHKQGKRREATFTRLADVAGENQASVGHKGLEWQTSSSAQLNTEVMQSLA